MRWNPLRFVLIAVILGLEAVAIYHVGTSDRPLLSRATLVAVIFAATVVGMVAVYYFVPAFWE